MLEFWFQTAAKAVSGNFLPTSASVWLLRGGERGGPGAALTIWQSPPRERSPPELPNVGRKFKFATHSINSINPLQSQAGMNGEV